jgi:glycerol-3-phosphate acyltransferase PlsY
MNEIATITPTILWLLLVWFFIGYAFGSVPFGLLVARVFHLKDPRSVGSGNIGATNILRTGSKQAAAATLVCDALKGTLPVALAMWFGGEIVAIAAGFGAFIGHILPVWLKFRGGKGVATYFGVLLGLNWVFFLISAAVWLGVALSTRISSLAALATAVVPFACALYIGNSSLAVALGLMGAIIFFTHRANISRLLKGEESRFGSKAKSP